MNEETMLYEQFWYHVEDFPLEHFIDVEFERKILRQTLAIRRIGKESQFYTVPYQSTCSFMEFFPVEATTSLRKTRTI